MTKLRRFIVLLLLTALAYLFQMVLFPLIPNLLCVPNFMLIVTVTSGLLFGRGTGIIMGVIAGLLSDLFGSGLPGFYILIYAWIGYLNGLLSTKVESEIIPALILFFTGNEILLHLYSFALSFLLRRSYDFGAYFTRVFLPELLLSLVLFLIIYGILVFIIRRFDLKLQKGEVTIV